MIATKREIYLLILAFVICQCGSFYLGSYTTTQNTNVISQQIYNQGLITGKALGVQQADAQHERVIRDLVADCKEWYEPFYYQGVNLTETTPQGVR